MFFAANDRRKRRHCWRDWARGMLLVVAVCPIMLRGQGTGAPAPSKLTTVLASLGVQAVIVGVGAAAFVTAGFYKNQWIAALVFLVLSAISLPLYVMVLKRLDGIAIERRETLIAELSRA